jgi:hypothetical protein
MRTSGRSLSAVFARTHAHGISEGGGEAALVLVADRCGNLRQTKLAFHQQQLGTLDALLRSVCFQRNAGRLMEQLIKLGLVGA